MLLCISKQTKNLVENVLREHPKPGNIQYVPHGIEESLYFPITNDPEFETWKKQITGENEYDFIGEAELQLKSLEHMLKLSNDIDDLKILFAPQLDDWIWNKDKDAKKNRQEVWGI